MLFSNKNGLFYLSGENFRQSLGEFLDNHKNIPYLSNAGGMILFNQKNFDKASQIEKNKLNQVTDSRAVPLAKHPK